MKRFIHLRHSNRRNYDVRPINPKHYGGATVAYEYNKEQRIIDVQIARCSDKDRYCRERGRYHTLNKPVYQLKVWPQFYDSPFNIYLTVLAHARSLIVLEQELSQTRFASERNNNG